jgi:Tn3 transposase DDE domain/HTH-like domain
VGPCDDATPGAHQEGIAESRFTGEGYRKIWARLRFSGVRSSSGRVRRLMRENGLLAPYRIRKRPDKAHDGTITTEAVDVLWGTDMTQSVTLAEGVAHVFVAVHHCKVGLYRIDGGDTGRLVTLIEAKRAHAEKKLGRAMRVVCCHDGFWLHRFLLARGIDNRVLDLASILVDRRARRAKTDRLDAAALLRTLMALERGERQVCRVVHVPTVADEDRRRLSRERERLLKGPSRLLGRGFTEAGSALRRRGRKPSGSRRCCPTRRTLFTLRWLESPALRKLITAELNKGEALNTLRRAAALHRLGRFRDRSHENQASRAATLNLVVAAIVLFNCRYLGRVLDALRSGGGRIDPAHARCDRPRAVPRQAHSLAIAGQLLQDERGRNGPVADGLNDTTDVVPIGRDQFTVETLPEERSQRAVTGRRLERIETPVGQPNARLEVEAEADARRRRPYPRRHRHRCAAP